MRKRIISNSLQVYPNPTQSEVNISFDTPGNSATIKLMDLSGKEVYAIKANNLDNSYQGSIDLAGLAKGVYMLRISTGETQVTRRLIKN